MGSLLYGDVSVMVETRGIILLDEANHKELARMYLLLFAYVKPSFL